MAQGVGHVNISDLREGPAWERLLEEVRVTNKPTIIRADGQDIAVLSPAKRKPRRSPSKARPVTEEDSLFHLIGIGESNTPGDISEHKHEYLSKAYREHHMR